MGLGETVDGALKTVGDGVSAGANAVGYGLDAVGWESGAELARDGGEWSADKYGSEVPERELGETDESGELIHGSPGDLREAVQHLKDFATAFEATGQALRKLDTEHWKGSTADAFRETFTGHPRRWLKAADSCTDAADALSSYASTVTWARQQATTAIEKWKTADHTSEEARRKHNQQIDDYNADADAYTAKAKTGADPGERPVRPGEFVDPGASGRQAAREILAEARRQRTDEAGTAQRKISAAAEDAPDAPGFSDRLKASVGDMVSGQVVEAQHFTGGFLKGAASTLRFARMINPMDTYNLTHPAEYGSNMATLGLGLVSAANHPVRTVKSMAGSGWSKDPAEAAGTFSFDIALDVATGGAGAGASAARRTAHAAEDVAEHGAQRAAREGAESASERAAREGGQEAASWDQLASSTPEVSKPAIHAGSVHPSDAQRFLDDQYPWLKDVNRTDEVGYTDNCSKNVEAVDKRLDGEEAYAEPLAKAAWPDPKILKDPMAKFMNVKSYDDIITDMAGRPEGARGVVYLSRSDGTAHVFNAVHGKHGVTFLDGQSGKLGNLEGNAANIQYMPYY